MNRKQIIDTIQWLLIAVLVCWVGYTYYRLAQQRTRAQEQEQIIASNTTYQKIYESQEIESLKQTNRELYDSISKLRDVESAVIVKYKYKYATDTILVDAHEQIADSLYHYESDNDTVKYTIDISARQLNWHKASFVINDQFTLVNQERDGHVTTSVVHSPNMEVVDMPTYHRKATFIEHFHVGPSVGVGYGVFNKKFDVYVGVSLTYEL